MSDETTEPTHEDDPPEHDAGGDLLARLKQLTAPIVESLDARLGGQIDRRVDARVDEVVRDRLAVIERALADLDRAVRALEDRLGD